MQLRTYDSMQDFSFSETQRLAKLLPQDFQLKVVVKPVSQADSKSVITCCARGQELLVQISFVKWQLFSIDQRNLLFWHELANIRGSSFSRIVKDKVLKIALVSLCLELFSQNLAGAIVALTITSLGIFDLYLKSWGEQFFKKATSADRDAIEIAQEFGYSLTQAQDSLYSALQILISQDNSRKNQVRLRVLEIMSTEAGKPFEQPYSNLQDGRLSLS